MISTSIRLDAVGSLEMKFLSTSSSWSWVVWATIRFCVSVASSDSARDTQNLIVAQTTQLQDELVLKNFISKDPTASNLIDVEIVPTDKPDAPQSIQLAPFADAVKEAFVNRPDVQEQILNVRNGEIDVKATKNALLPQATLTGTYSSTGLAGNSLTATTPPVLDK